MTAINSNIGALRAQQGVTQAQASLSTAMERLSTGKRINSAKDDAAGLAVAQRMTADVRGLGVAIRNANDGISLAQTAEGAMGEVTNMLQRLRELAVQGASGTITADDRKALQVEVKQLVAEIDNVATRTTFNGVKLLDGSARSLSLQTGTRGGETVTVSLGSARAGDLGTGDSAGLTATGSFNATTANLRALSTGDLVVNGVAIGASQAADDNVSSAAKAASAVAKAAAINRASEQTGVRAVVGQTVMTGTAMTGAGLTGTVTINGQTTASITTTSDTAASRRAVADAINAIRGETGVTAVDTGDDRTGLRLVAADGRNIDVSLDTLTAAATGLKTGGQTGTFSLVSDGRAITLGSSGSGSIGNAGLAAGSFGGGLSGVASDQRAVASAANGSDAYALANGDLVINGVAIRGASAADDVWSDATAGSSTKAGSAIAIAAAINASSAETGVTATANALTLNGSTTTVIGATATATLVVNGVSMDITLDAGHSAQQTRDNVIAQVNRYSGLHGVTASDEGKGGVSLTAADGRNVSVWFDSDEAAAANFGLGGVTVAGAGTAYTVTGVTDPTNITSATVNTAYATVSLSSTGPIDVRAGSQGFGTASNFTRLGFEDGRYGSDGAGLKVKDVDLTTQAGATAALAAIDSALSSIGTDRAGLGAVQNRLDATVSQLSSR
ncbi:MAG: flagellin, partial [Alphaproteobacteria bacterium]|nr:flagellin [Alphaproteobacteria bacterium]